MSAVRLHDRLLWALLPLAGVVIGVYALWPASAALPVLGSVGDFQLTERGGAKLTRADLQGRVWIAGFTFNCCTMSCPQIRAALRSLQDELASTRVLLVSFSVDPEADTPAALAELANGLGADPRRWLFLTAHGQGTGDDVRRLAESGFHASVVENPAAPPGERFAHSSRLYLVDRQGRVRGSYRCVEEQTSAQGSPTGAFLINDAEMRRLRDDAVRLDGGLLGGHVRLGWLPTWNAALNATSGTLLVLGWLLIRRRLIKPHAVCMLAAVAVSALFLASYLYYHYHAGTTRFQGTGWVRPLYLAILGSHTVLAAAVPFLAGWTLYRAARREWDRHRRVARWTLPIWLYVSVTGVLTYLFLYHWFPG